MAFTLHITDSTNPKVLAFMEYVKSLDFVNVIEEEIVNHPTLSDQEIIDRVLITRQEIKEDKLITQEALIEKIKKW